MCQRLGELREAMGDYATRFDPALVSAPDAARVVEDASAIERLAATLKAQAAARVAETGAWRASGDRSAAHHLARTTGTSVGHAAGVIETARRLQQLPETAAAAGRGELSADQSAAIAEAATADPAAERRLLERAKRSSLGELRDECARTKAAALPDGEARRRRIHEQRYLRTHTDAEGAWNLRVRNNPEVGATIMAALRPIADRLFRAARASGQREPAEAYAADALTELAGGAGDERGRSSESEEADATGAATSDGNGAPGDAGQGGGPVTRRPSAGAGAGRNGSSAKVIVRVDLDALLRGYPVTGELAELVGYGPVAVSAIRDMIDTGDPFLAAVATKGVDVVGVAHLGRKATAHQQTCLEWLYPTCAAEGCSAVSRLEVDHRLDWATTRVTVVDLLDRLCSHHHGLKTLDGWSLVEGKGKRAFVAPEDPRHPGPARPPPTPPATGPPAATAPEPAGRAGVCSAPAL